MINHLFQRAPAGEGVFRAASVFHPVGWLWQAGRRVILVNLLGSDVMPGPAAKSARMARRQFDENGAIKMCTEGDVTAVTPAVEPASIRLNHHLQSGVEQLVPRVARSG